VPYRATRKSWVMDEHRSSRPMIEAFLETTSELGENAIEVTATPCRHGPPAGWSSAT
jgi:hypothetical protein